MYEYSIQLCETGTSKVISHGGSFYVVSTGTPSRVALYDKSDVAMNNPVTINNGLLYFRTAESVASVDVYGMTNKGIPFVIRSLKPGDRSVHYMGVGTTISQIVIPFDMAAAPAAVLPALTANTEFFTGIFLAKNQLVMPEGMGVVVTTADSAKTINVGVNSTSGNDDPAGWLNAAPLTTAAFVEGAIGYTVGTNSILIDVTGGTQEWTLGALLSPANTRSASKAEGTDSTTTKNGLWMRKSHVAGDNAVAAKKEEITFTLSSGATTAAGFLILPTRLTQPFII